MEVTPITSTFVKLITYKVDDEDKGNKDRLAEEKDKARKEFEKLINKPQKFEIKDEDKKLDIKG